MYYLLTESFRENEKKLVDIIVKCGEIAQVYFLGSTHLTRRTESIFMPDAPSCRKADHYFLLVIISSGNLNKTQDKIESNCNQFIEVTAIVFYKKRFEQWLKEGHEFANTVYQKAVLLYGSKDTQPPITLVHNNNNNAADQKELIKAQGLSKVNDFIAGAEFYLQRKNYGLSAFMLHQAFEQSFNTLLKFKTGLHLTTHNLEKLYRCCCMIDYRLSQLFSDSLHLFNIKFSHLQSAYKGGRYNEISVTKQEIIQLLEVHQRLKAALDFQD